MDDSAEYVNPAHAVRMSLPTVLTSFIGRERELAEIARLVHPGRLVALTGVAGCGKTRLALRVASANAFRFPDGVFWIELTRLTDPDLIPSFIAREFGIRPQPGRSNAEALIDALRDKRFLLVLDNCEHLLVACSHLAETILSETAGGILATSRESLNAAGELRYPVSPMELPPHGDAVEHIAQAESVQLFVDRAQAILPSFALTVENAGQIQEVCHRLDGLPLAIELASARVNVLTLQEITSRLEDRFIFLNRASPMTRTHHETLKSAITWSYDLLTPSERTLFRRLSVFAGGFSLAMAEQICSGGDVERDQVLDLVASLISKSLVIAHTLDRVEARYNLLETIRDFGRDELIASGEQYPLRDRHLQCYVRLAEDIAEKLTGQFQQLWMDWLETEFDNLRAALSWSIESQQLEAGLRIAVALYEFWTVRDVIEEGLEWYGRLINGSDETVPTDVLANALGKAGLMAGFRGNISLQAEYASEAARLAEATGEEGKRALLWALVAISQGARGAGENELEFRIARQVIEIERELGDTYLLGVSLSTYSTVAMNLGDFAKADAMLTEGLTLLRDHGDPYRIGQALNYRGDLARCERNYRQARSAYEESARYFRESHADRDLASTLHNLAYTCVHEGDIDRARELFAESLTLQQSQSNVPGIAECLAGFGGLAITLGLPAAGARLFAAARQIGGDRIATAWPATRMEFEYFTLRARTLLGESAYSAEQDAGRQLSLDDAISHVRQLTVDLARMAQHRSRPDTLTTREQEVAALIAQGKSNAEIAGELWISKRTVEKHVANILSKLQFTKRTQIVRWAIESRLTSLS
jgi:predicted ATPase/DNA-binding CsgD family transcriptional regulator